LRSAQKRPSPPATNSKKTPTWFAFSAARILCRLWTTWTGIRGTKPNAVEGEHTLFGFLRTEANDVVGAVHPKAMPVMLTPGDNAERWLTGEVADACSLAVPFADTAMRRMS